jgi:hypothetical protein
LKKNQLQGFFRLGDLVKSQLEVDVGLRQRWPPEGRWLIGLEDVHGFRLGVDWEVRCRRPCEWADSEVRCRRPCEWADWEVRCRRPCEWADCSWRWEAGGRLNTAGSPLSQNRRSAKTGRWEAQGKVGAVEAEVADDGVSVAPTHSRDLGKSSFFADLPERHQKLLFGVGAEEGPHAGERLGA